jgi:RNase H-fold protein (predicted Holliday junction resolvase)
LSIEKSHCVIAIDPGKVKCGLVFVQTNGSTKVERAVVPAEHLVVSLSKLVREHPEVDDIVIGSGTGSGTLSRAIRNAFPGKKLVLVDEKGTSLLARVRYFEEHPPRGWRRLLPLGMQLPQEPYDDYAALLLAERYLTSNSESRQSE